LILLSLDFFEQQKVTNGTSAMKSTNQHKKATVQRLLNEGYPEKASKLAAIMCSEYPYDSEAHLMYGVALLNSSQYAAAKEMLCQAIAKFPDEWQFYEFLGYAYFYLDKPKDAEKEYRTAITKGVYASKQELAELRCALADVLWVQNKRDEALDEWHLALHIDPKCKEAKQSLKECTNVYGEPKALSETFDDLYHFQKIHIQRYFALVGREKFVTEKEMQTVLDIVQNGWNHNIPPRLQEFDRMTPKEKSAFFKSITLNFTNAVVKWRKNTP
jgi:tetratricopeptide (TPR) repeat protein